MSLTIALAGHGVAWARLCSIFPYLPISPRWPAQCLFLIVLSLALSAVTAAIPPTTVRLLGLLALRFVVFLIIAFPLGAEPVARSALLAALAFDAATLAPSPVDLVAGAVMVAAGVFLPRSTTAWDAAVRPPDLASAAESAFSPFALMLVGASYKHFRSMALKGSDMLVRAQRTNLDLIETNIVLRDKVMDMEGMILRLERGRISRELHDTIGYTLMNILVMQKAAAVLLGRDDARAAGFIEKTISQAEAGLRGTREAVRTLVSMRGGAVGIAGAVVLMAKAFEGTHIHIEVNLNNSAQSYGKEADEALRSFVQEAITNAIKHGNADSISIHFWREVDALSVSVRDNGTGWAGGGSLIEGQGITGMRQRMVGLGGEVSYEGLPDGFRVSASLPAAALGGEVA